MAHTTKQTKQTQTAAAAAALVAAAKPAKAAKAAKPAAVETDEGEGDEGDEPTMSQWAREQLRHAEGKGAACARFYALAAVLSAHADKCKPGQSVSVSYTKANTEAKLSRGERGEPHASWRLFVGKMVTTFAPGLSGDDKREAFAAMWGYTVAVDTDASALVVTRNAK